MPSTSPTNTHNHNAIRQSPTGSLSHSDISTTTHSNVNPSSNNNILSRSSESPYLAVHLPPSIREEVFYFENSHKEKLRGVLWTRVHDNGNTFAFSAVAHQSHSNGSSGSSTSNSSAIPISSSSSTAAASTPTSTISVGSSSTSPSVSASENAPSLSPTNSNGMQTISAHVTVNTALQNLPRAVVLCHGMAARAEWGFLPELSLQILTEVRSVSAILRFDFSGHGKSEGVFEYGGYKRYCSDVASAIAWVQSRGYSVHTLMGHSMGANVTLLHASSHIGNIPNIVNLSGRFKMTRGLPFSEAALESLKKDGYFYWNPRGPDINGEPVKITQATIDERLSTDMECARLINSHGNVRILSIHGTADRGIPVEDAYKLHELLKPTGGHTLRTIDDADHNFTNEQHRMMMITTLCEWLAKEPTSVLGSPVHKASLTFTVSPFPGSRTQSPFQQLNTIDTLNASFHPSSTHLINHNSVLRSSLTSPVFSKSPSPLPSSSTCHSPTSSHHSGTLPMPSSTTSRSSSHGSMLPHPSNNVGHTSTLKNDVPLAIGESEPNTHRRHTSLSISHSLNATSASNSPTPTSQVNSATSSPSSLHETQFRRQKSASVSAAPISPSSGKD